MKVKTKNKDVCGFSYGGRKCTCTDIVGISRCVPLCMVHFKAVKEDNIRRFNKGLDITKEMKFTKKLFKNHLWSIFEKSLTNEKGVKKNGN